MSELIGRKPEINISANIPAMTSLYDRALKSGMDRDLTFELGNTTFVNSPITRLKTLLDVSPLTPQNAQVLKLYNLSCYKLETCILQREPKILLTPDKIALIEDQLLKYDYLTKVGDDGKLDPTQYSITFKMSRPDTIDQKNHLLRILFPDCLSEKRWKSGIEEAFFTKLYTFPFKTKVFQLSENTDQFAHEFDQYLVVLKKLLEIMLPLLANKKDRDLFQINYDLIAPNFDIIDGEIESAGNSQRLIS